MARRPAPACPLPPTENARRPGTLNPSGFRGEWLGPESNRGSDAPAALILSGVEECSECAELLDVPKDTVSKRAKKLQKAGTIRIEGRKYLPAADNKQTGK